MAVSVILKLEHGKDILNLNSGRYCLDDADFMPPTTARAVTFGSLVAGAEKVSQRRENRAWSFSINIEASSKSEAERALRNLQAFLNRAGERTPLYVLYRSFNDYDFEPYFGLHGAFMRYEVAHASAEVAQGYNAPLGNSNKIVRVRVDMTIKPQALGLQQQAGQAKGFIFEDYIGKADGVPRGTVIETNYTNSFTNPIFSSSLSDEKTGWTTAGSGFVTTINTDPAYVLFGDRSIRCTKTSIAAGDSFTQSLNLAAVTQYFSCYVKMIDGSAPTGINIWYNSSTQTTTQTAVGDGWYRLTASATGTATSVGAGISPTSNQNVFYVDGFQVTTAQHRTLIYGDLLGCSWTGTKHGSTSSSTAAYLRYDFADFIADRTGWTIRVAWLPPVGGSSTRYFLEDSSDNLQLYIDGSNQVVCQVSSSNSVTSSAITITAGTPIILHVTYDGANLDIYNAGTNIGAGNSKVAGSAEPTYVYVGTDDDAGNHCSGTLLGVATFRRAMSATEVSADYAQAIQQVTDGDRLDPLPWVWTNDGDNVVDNEQDDSATFCHVVVGGLMGDNADAHWDLASSSAFSTYPGITTGTLPIDQVYFDRDILVSGGTFSILFRNASGSTDSSANADNYLNQSISTTDTSIEAGVNVTVADRLLRHADNITGYFVYKETNTVDKDLEIRMGVDLGTDIIYSEYRTVTGSTSAYTAFATLELPINFDELILNSERQMAFTIRGKRPAGASTDHIQISHSIFFPNYSAAYLGDGGVNTDAAYIDGRKVELVQSTVAANTIAAARSLNRPLALRPNLLNLVFFQHTYSGYVWTSSATLTVTQLAVTPRFDIL